MIEKTFKKLRKDDLPDLLRKDYLICLAIIIFCFTLDRFTKMKIINVQQNDNSIYINKFLNFDLVWNTGVGFGFLSSISNLAYNFVSLLIGLVLIFLIYLIIKSKFTEKILFSLILGGALGNFFDRIYFFAVPDFIDFHFNKFHWFTFNMADIFITLGIFILIGKDLFTKDTN